MAKGARALDVVQKYFPRVKSVKDAGRGVIVEVTSHDQSRARRRNHTTCALAVACKRAMGLDGVLISLKTAYLIRGTHAVRYSLGEHISREIVSFDRGLQFQAGKYRLTVPTTPLGYKPPQGTGKSGGRGGDIRPHVFTSGIRTVLGATDVA